MDDVLRSRSQRRSRRREIFDALDGALDRALDLGLDPLRDRCQIKPRGRVHFCSPEGGKDVGGAGRAAAMLSCVMLDTAFICCSIALISLSWLSMFCSRSAMPTICARLGRFMLTRYFSMNSPNCFCAPAETPPAWFMALENSGDDIVWLAKA